MDTQELLAAMSEGPAKAAVRKQLGEQTQASAERAKRRNKYGNKRTVVDGITFDSRREAAFYGRLKFEQRERLVRWFCLQPRFVLPGGVVYVADFLARCADGAVIVYDAKGVKTKEYRIKKRLMLATYGIEIVEV